MILTHCIVLHDSLVDLEELFCMLVFEMETL